MLTTTRRRFIAWLGAFLAAPSAARARVRERTPAELDASRELTNLSLEHLADSPLVKIDAFPGSLAPPGEWDADDWAWVESQREGLLADARRTGIETTLYWHDASGSQIVEEIEAAILELNEAGFEGPDVAFVHESAWPQVERAFAGQAPPFMAQGCRIERSKAKKTLKP